MAGSVVPKLGRRWNLSQPPLNPDGPSRSNTWCVLGARFFTDHSITLIHDIPAKDYFISDYFWRVTDAHYLLYIFLPFNQLLQGIKYLGPIFIQMVGFFLRGVVVLGKGQFGCTALCRKFIADGFVVFRGIGQASQ
jgi:hypothetical protein